mmetsp:Transcript_25230/g.47884  ORF Transcript_25230/g.47884 Transcript_25230/m.47884 type:complete len:116 (+) Transcript_25230:103-450(+)|eukprot:scaffold4270_cov166-Amphora_coffeaeformis.AAC.6
MMRLLLSLVALLLALLVEGTTAFGMSLPPRTTCTTTTFLLLAQKKQSNPKAAANNKKTITAETKNPVKEMLKMMITGSPDGIASFGKPQHDWSGKSGSGSVTGGTSNPTVWKKKD